MPGERGHTAVPCKAGDAPQGQHPRGGHGRGWKQREAAPAALILLPLRAQSVSDRSAAGAIETGTAITIQLTPPPAARLNGRAAPVTWGRPWAGNTEQIVQR